MYTEADPDFWKGGSKSKHPFTEPLKDIPVQIFNDANYRA